MVHGTELQLWECNGLDAQKFEYDSEGQGFTLPGNLCIDLPGGDAYNGAHLWIWDCYGGNNQKFTLGDPPPPPTPTPKCNELPVVHGLGNLEVYPAPSSSFPHGPFTVLVDQGKYNSRSSFVYESKAPGNAPDAQKGKTASWTTFAFTGSVVVHVEPHSPWSVAVVRPLSLGISVCRFVNAAVFTLTQPGHVEVEFDGNTQHSMMIFGEGPEAEEDKSADIVFGPGEHDVGTFVVDASTSIRLEGGAWVRGQFLTKAAGDSWWREKSGIKIVGRGVLSGENIPHPNEATDSKAMLGLCGDDITIKGITIVNPPTYMVNINPYWLGCGGTRALVEGVKAMGWHFTTDGIMVGRDSTVRGNFVRANDDSLKLYMSNTVWEKNTIWQEDNGQSFMLSWNTDSSESNITVRDCTVIHVEHQWDYGDNPPARPAVFGAVHGGAGYLSQFSFQNIIVEGPVFRPFGFSQAKSQFGGSGAGSISGVALQGVSFTGYARTSSVINGHISHVAFEGLTYEGQKVHSAHDGNFDVSLGASDVTFSGAGANNLSPTAEGLLV